MKQKLKFRKAHTQDIVKLVLLINASYRQQEGSSWTSEAEIVAGDRINATQLEQSLNQDNFLLFVAEQSATSVPNEIIACIGLTFTDEEVEIGTFCIAPHFQNQGLGKQVLDFAERYVIDAVLAQQTDFKYFVMWVLSVRYELIAYYQRRDYQITGIQEDYPLQANVGQPLLDLHLIEMKKPIL